jgi:hypothetical protein
VIRTFVGAAPTSSVLAITHKSYASEPIDLDSPGKLEAIARDRPNHFAAIQRILAEVPRQPSDEAAVATWMRTQFDAQDIRYADFFMTSLPPKKRLAFSLDNTAYVKVITLTDWGAKAVPVPAVAPTK